MLFEECAGVRECDKTRGQTWGDLEYSRMTRGDNIKAEVRRSSMTSDLKLGGGGGACSRQNFRVTELAGCRESCDIGTYT